MLHALQLLKFSGILAFAAMVNSQEINAAEQLVFGNERADTNDFKSFEKPALSDLLTIESSLSVFYDYVRQSETLVSSIRLI